MTSTARWQIATAAHDRQKDKTGGSYFDHVQRVAEAVEYVR